MNELKIFQKEEFGQVRVQMINDEPMFCLADLCRAVELSNPSSVRKRLDNEDVQLIDLHALNSNEGGNMITNFITESAVYDVLLQSSSKKVKQFRKWVTSDVLPTIRKTGGYVSDTSKFVEEYFGEMPDSAKQFMVQTLDSKKALLEHNKKQQAQLLLQEPKVEGYDAMINGDGTFSMMEASDILGYGRNKFMAILRGMSILQKNNVAYRRYIDAGYFIERIGNKNGINFTTTRVTPKGMDWLKNKLREQ